MRDVQAALACVYDFPAGKRGTLLCGDGKEENECGSVFTKVEMSREVSQWCHRVEVVPL